MSRDDNFETQMRKLCIEGTERYRVALIDSMEGSREKTWQEQAVEMRLAGFRTHEIMYKLGKKFNEVINATIS